MAHGKRRRPGYTLEDLIYDPIGYQFRGGSFTRRPYGGHQHVHAASSNPWVMLALIRFAQRRNLAVRENPYTDPVDPVHVHGSEHYKKFRRLFHGKRLGKAVDVSGDPEDERAFFRYARAVMTGRRAIGRGAGGGGGGGGRGQIRTTMGPPQANLAALLASLGAGGPQATVPNVRVPKPYEILAGLSASAIEHNAAGAMPLLESSPLAGRASSLTSDLASLRRRLLAL